VTVNVLSLFAFIMVLGIVVDDAIVIGESIYTEAQQKAAKVLGNDKNGVFSTRIEDVIEGAKKVAIPSTIGVLTTMAAFAPMLFIGGVVAGFQEAIAVVVILCLVFSLIESKLILPAHLVGMKIGGVSHSRFQFIGQLQSKVDKGLRDFIENKYQPALAYCLKRRYLTVSFFLGLLIIAGGAVNSGIAKFEFFPNVPSDTVRAEVIVYDGTSASSMADILTTIEDAAYRVDESYRQQYPEGKGLVKHLLFYAGLRHLWHLYRVIGSLRRSTHFVFNLRKAMAGRSGSTAQCQKAAVFCEYQCRWWCENQLSAKRFQS
jgi:multidrug efflux pump subunit AcrB